MRYRADGIARLNDEDRRQWVLNDYDLYGWWQSERPRQALGAFVRANRATIDQHVTQALRG